MRENHRRKAKKKTKQGQLSKQMIEVPGEQQEHWKMPTWNLQRYGKHSS